MKKNSENLPMKMLIKTKKRRKKENMKLLDKKIRRSANLSTNSKQIDRQT